MIKLISYYRTSAFFFFLRKMSHHIQGLQFPACLHGKRHCLDPEFHFSTNIAFNKSLFFFEEELKYLIEAGKG